MAWALNMYKCNYKNRYKSGFFLVVTLVQHNLHFSFSCREFSLFFSTFFLIGRKCAKTRTKSQKLTTSLSLFSSSLIPLAFEWPSRKKAWTMRSPRGLMANSGIRRKSSRVKYPLSCLSKLVNLLQSRSIWLAVTVTNNLKKGNMIIFDQGHLTKNRFQLDSHPVSDSIWLIFSSWRACEDLELPIFLEVRLVTEPTEVKVQKSYLDSLRF